MNEMPRLLPHLMARVFNTPLMIAPAKLEAMLPGLPGIIARRGSHNPDRLARATARMETEGGAPPPRNPGYQVARGGVAILPVQGVLVRKPGQMTPDSTPLQSYDRIKASLTFALNDPQVRAVLLDVDSPGGEAGAVLDLSREIRAAGAVKTIWAIANDDAFSAAYVIASAASRVWVTNTGGAGSIGVMALHADRSERDAAEGLRFTYIHAGARKVDLNPHQPLSEEAHGLAQAEVDRLYGMMCEGIAGHRGITAAAVRDTEAGCFYGPNALAAGLADELGTPADARGALAEAVNPSSMGAPRMSEHTPAAPVRLQSDPNPNPQPQPDPPANPNPPAPPAPQPQPDPPAQPAQAAHAAAVPLPGGNVVHLDVAAVTGARQRMDTEILAACELAGASLTTAKEMIASSLTLDQIRTELQSRKTRAADANVTLPVDTNAEATAAASGITPGFSREVMKHRTVYQPPAGSH
jgi:signal peptide peptidase SppA